MTRLDKHVKSFQNHYRLHSGVCVATDNKHRVIAITKPVEGIEFGDAEEKDKTFQRNLELFYEEDFCRAELPAKEDLKKMIAGLVGRRRSIRVAYVAEGCQFVADARYLLEAMEALNAEGVYVGHGSRMPLYMVENDDLYGGKAVELILPVLLNEDVREYAGKCYLPPSARMALEAKSMK